MLNPLVSVIIPAYNAEKTIGNALDTVFGQTYRPIEVIVIDDGSTDKTAEIVKNYVQGIRIVRDVESDPTIRTYPTSEAIELKYIYQQNSGPSKARNSGIKAARGEYIAFLDADDLWIKEKIEKQVELFTKDPKLDVIFSDTKVTRYRGEKVNEFTIFNKENLNKEFFGHGYILINPPEKLLKLNFIYIQSVIAKRSCFKNDIFFNEKRRYMEDWELCLKMSINYTFGYLNEVCVHVLDEGDGLSSNSINMSIEHCNVLDSFFMENKDNLSSYMPIHKLAKCFKDHYKWGGYFFMMNGNTKRAREFFRKSMRESLDIKVFLYYFKSLLYDLIKF
jgi:glycosyltransferase involved in cell wall biosynthesis